MSFAPRETEPQGKDSPKEEQSNHNWIVELAQTAKNNALLPALNSFLVEPINACVNVINGASSFVRADNDNAFRNPAPILPKMSEFEVVAAKPGTGAAFTQQIFSTAGSFLIYPIVGKLAGKGFAPLAEFAPAELEIGQFKLGQGIKTFARDERVAMVFGASTYAGLKDPKQGESRLSNVLGTAVGFSAFEIGNAKFVDAAAPLLNRVGQRFQVGVAGGIAQTNTESLIQQGQLAADFGGSISGGVLNALMPAGKRITGDRTEVVHQEMSPDIKSPFTTQNPQETRFDLHMLKQFEKEAFNPPKAVDSMFRKPFEGVKPFDQIMKSPFDAVKPFDQIMKSPFDAVKPFDPMKQPFDAKDFYEAKIADKANTKLEQDPKPKLTDGQKQSDADFFGHSDKITGVPFWDNLINKIHEKFSPRPLRRTELTDMVRSLPAEDQKLALNILKASSDFANSVNLREWLNKLDLEKSVASYTINPDSAGNFLGYFFKKSSKSYGQFNLNSLDSLVDAYHKDPHSLPDKIVIFDNCSKASLTAEQRELLSKIPNVKIVDTGAFERGINLIDIAKGPEFVANKLKQIIQETRKNNGASTSGAVDDFLNAGQHDSLQLGPNVEILNPDRHFGREITSYDAVDFTDAGAKPSDKEILDTYDRLVKTKSEKQDIWAFLEKQKDPQQRALAAELLLEGGQYRSIASQLESAKTLHEQLLTKAKSLNINEGDIVYVTNLDPGGSSHMTTHLYKEANHIDASQLVSMQQLRELNNSGQLSKKMVVYLDDISGSGDQARDILEYAGTGFPAGKHFCVALLGAFRQGAEKANKYLQANPKEASFIAAKQYEGVFSENNSFFNGLPDDQKIDIRKLGGDPGHGHVGAAFANSHMAPDINVGLFDDFARQVLHLPGS